MSSAQAAISPATSPTLMGNDPPSVATSWTARPYRAAPSHSLQDHHPPHHSRPPNRVTASDQELPRAQATPSPLRSSATEKPGSPRYRGALPAARTSAQLR